VKSRRLQWDGHVVRIEGTKNALRILVGKSLGECPVEKLRRSGRISLR
jgi:hypothetical protein